MTTLDALPNRRVEGWRWSDLSAALGGRVPESAPPPAEHPVPSSRFGQESASEYAFADAWPTTLHQAPRSHPRKGQFLQRQMPKVEDAASLSRMAFERASDRAYLTFIQSTAPRRDVIVRHIGGATDVSRHEPLGVVVHPGQKLTVIETFEGTAAGFTNALMPCSVGKGGEFNRIVLQSRSVGATYTGAAVQLAEHATFRQFVLLEGAKFCRAETEVSVQGEAAHVELNGVYLADHGAHADLTSLVDLETPGATVRQLVRGVARKGGRGVFQGKFLVERAAQKTDAEMRHNALLLEEGAEVFAKPELEIYADDVACAHGNTAGQLDEDAIFYLRQRGIPDVDARAMITRAFLVEAVPDWIDEGLRGEIEARIDRWLGTAA